MINGLELHKNHVLTINLKFLDIHQKSKIVNKYSTQSHLSQIKNIWHPFSLMENVTFNCIPKN